MIMITRWC